MFDAEVVIPKVLTKRASVLYQTIKKDRYDKAGECYLYTCCSYLEMALNVDSKDEQLLIRLERYVSLLAGMR